MTNQRYCTLTVEQMQGIVEALEVLEFAQHVPCLQTAKDSIENSIEAVEYYNSTGRLYRGGPSQLELIVFPDRTSFIPVTKEQNDECDTTGDRSN